MRDDRLRLGPPRGKDDFGLGDAKVRVATGPSLRAAGPLLAASMLPAGGHCLDLEEAAERDSAADGADGEADEDDDQRRSGR